MMYELVYWDKNLKKRIKPYNGTYDGARKQACMLLLNGKAKYNVTIKRPNTPGWNTLGEVSRNMFGFTYISNRAGEGIVWAVNTKTGKLKGKIGYVD